MGNICNVIRRAFEVADKVDEHARIFGLTFAFVEAFDVLIDETAAKVHVLSPSQAQTGPAIRYDENVIGKHLEALASHPEWQDLYERISKSIHNDKLRSETN